MIVMIVAGSIATGSGVALAVDSAAMPSVVAADFVAVGADFVAADFMAVAVDTDNSHESLICSWFGTRDD
jgi:hypothetical protein